MKVTISFSGTKIVVPCGEGDISVRELTALATTRYKKAIGKPGDYWVSVSSLKSYEGGILDPDDYIVDVCDDREQLQALFDDERGSSNHSHGDGMSSEESPNEMCLQVRRGSEPVLNQVDSEVGGGYHHPYEDEEACLLKPMLHQQRLNSPRIPSRVAQMAESFESRVAIQSSEDPTKGSLHVLRRREPLGASANKPVHKEKAMSSSTQGKDELLEVVIANESGPLGIHVVPCELDGRLVVQGIEPGGRVDRNGRLAVGDEVVEINGSSLGEVSFNKAQDIFKSALLDPELRLRVIKGGDSIILSEGCSDNKENISEKKMMGDLVPGTKITSAVNANNTRKIGKVMRITLTKGNSGLGFSITGRDNAPGGSTPIYIKNVLPKGAAIEEGNLKPGDRLLEVNSCRVDGMSQSEVVSLLRSAPLHSNLELVVSRHLDTTSSYPAEEQPAPPPVQSPPKKDSPHGVPISTEEFPWKHRKVLTFDIPVHDTERAGLGVSVKGKTSTGKAGIIDLGIFVKSVLHGGAASRDGRLRTNDQLVDINGLSLLGKPNPLAMETLRKAMHEEGPVPGIISLTIARRLPEEEEEGSGAHRAYAAKPTVDKRDSLSSLMTSSSDDMIREYSVSAPANNNNNFKVPGAVRNPVLDRLMGKENHPSSLSAATAASSQQQNIRNESYYMATNDTFNATMIKGGPNSEMNAPPPPPPVLSVSDSSVMIEQPHFSIDSPGSVPFARDQPGRQSMSEKRHATLDAKNTDTYQKRKKAREERLLLQQQQQQHLQHHGLWKKSASLESLTTLGGSTAVLKQYSRAEREALKDNYYVRTNSVRVSRNRGCNESFRAAVDRSYEGGGAEGQDLHHASGPDFEIEDPDLVLQAPETAHSTTINTKKTNRNSRFLKNLGTMFKISGGGGGSGSGSGSKTVQPSSTKTLPSKKSQQQLQSSPGNSQISKSRSGGSLSKEDGIYDTLVPISSAMTRPGSRVGIADPGQNTGCSDYELIQRHLQSSRSRAHPFEQAQNAGAAAAYLRQQQQQQQTSSSQVPRSRPKSNYYDYESWNFAQNAGPISSSAYGRYYTEGNAIPPGGHPGIYRGDHIYGGVNQAGKQ